MTTRGTHARTHAILALALFVSGCALEDEPVSAERAALSSEARLGTAVLGSARPAW